MFLSRGRHDVSYEMSNRYRVPTPLRKQEKLEEVYIIPDSLHSKQNINKTTMMPSILARLPWQVSAILPRKVESSSGN